MFNAFRHFSSGTKTFPKTHYDALGVSSKATQADIKSAYYKLSMVYHPDKNKGSEEASKQFRDITTAYEVLGNVRLRKLYDRGMSLGEPTPRATRNDDRLSRFYQSRDVRRGPTHQSHGFNPIYNFDEWNKAHYGTTFARDMATKTRRQIKEQYRQDSIRMAKMERVVLLVAFLIVTGTYYLQSATNYDMVPHDTKKV